MTEQQKDQIQQVASEIRENINFRGDEGRYFRRQMIQECLNNGAQSIHTPFKLCGEMLSKLNECVVRDGKSLKDMKIAVLFNVEFVELLCDDYKVPPENITFFADSISEMMWVKEGYRIGPFEEKIFEIGGKINFLPDKKGNHDSVKYLKRIVKEKNMKFDCVIMNPPYQAAKNIKGPRKGTIGGDLWSKFVSLAFDVAKDDGYICSVHPSMWRKPEHDLYPLFQNNNLIYLNINGEKEGQKTFRASTRYDWYVLQKYISDNKTTIIDEFDNEHKIDLKDWDFLPNAKFDLIAKLLAKDGEERCEVLYSRSAYGSDKKWMSREKTEEFKYPCVHGLTQKGTNFWYSSINDKGHFGVPKVILTWGRHQYPLIDMEGQYGMTQIVFGLKVDSREEAEGIKKAIETDRFKDLLVVTKWSQFQTEYRMFKYFRKDFWREFV